MPAFLTWLTTRDAATTLDGTELFIAEQASGNVRVTADQIASFVYAEAGAINLGTLGLVGDGVTDNTAACGVIRALIPTLTTSAAETATITIASPAVVTLTAHGFNYGQPLVFTTTGTLPDGITAGTTYYVNTTNLTTNTFEITDTNPNIYGAQTSLTTSGSQSGVHSVARQGDDWVDVVIPPGAYVNATANTQVVTLNGAKKVRVSGYGARTTDFWFGNNSFSNAVAYTFGTATTAYFNTVQASLNTLSITLATLADVSKVKVGSWVCLMALDVQGTVSYPPNNHYFEFRKITAINSGTGELTLDRRLVNSYLDTYPLIEAGSSSVLPNGGPAMLAVMHPTWEQEVHIRGIHFEDAGQQYPNTRIFRMEDCYFDGQAIIPTVCKQWEAVRCIFTNSGGPEFDKLVEYAKLKDCILDTMSIQSSSVGLVEVDTCDINFFSGTARNTKISNSAIGVLSLGPLGQLGVSETILIENCRINSVTYNHKSIATTGNNMIERYSYSSGTFSFPMSEGAVSWAVPGAKAFVADMRQDYPNMGSPFVVLDVRTDGSNTLVDTTLAAKPVGISTNATVTISIASPAVVSWTGHGLAAGTAVAFATTGALPTGISAGGVYYVIAAGLGADVFEISASIAGSAVNTSGSQSGVHTGVSDPLMFAPHPAPRITVRGSVGCSLITALSEAPDEQPLFSYAKRLYALDSAGTSGAGQSNLQKIYVWGNLKSLTVNVLRAYSGGEPTLTLAITADGFDTSLVASNLSQTIDMKTAGKRIITPTGTTGSAGSDSIAAYGDWIAGDVTTTFSVDVSGVTAPLFSIEIITDQGVTSFPAMQFYTTEAGGPTAMYDTNTSASA